MRLFWRKLGWLFKIWWGKPDGCILEIFPQSWWAYVRTPLFVVGYYHYSPMPWTGDLVSGWWMGFVVDPRWLLSLPGTEGGSAFLWELRRTHVVCSGEHADELYAHHDCRQWRKE